MSGFRPRFFVRQESVSAAGGASPGPGVEITFGTEDSHHAARVLRLREGDACEVVVGVEVYSATVRHSEPPVKVELGARLEGEAAGAQYRLDVGVVQAVTRATLFDQVLEKGTEVGTSFFVLLASDPEPRRKERWRRIVAEAAKQSKQVRVPSIAAVSSLGEAREHLEATETRSLVLHPDGNASLRDGLEEMLAVAFAGGPTKDESGRAEPRRERLALWVGPESGWSADDLEWFGEAGLMTVRLGRSVLRTETAGPVAVALARLILGDW